jgi:CelD/BcsL family acetyltransferase involved in cellulose biosynthesis
VSAFPQGQNHLQGKHVVTIVSQFAELQSAMQPLRRNESAVDLFATWTWFENLASSGIEAHLRQAFVLVRHLPSDATFCLPLLCRPRSPAAALGGATTSLSNYYSSLFAPIGDPACVTVAGLRAAITHARKHLGVCAVLDFQPLDAESPFYRTLLAALAAEGYITDPYFCFGNWHLKVGGRSFAQYEPSIPSRLRNTYKRGRKKLEASGDWSLVVHTQPGEELEQAIADFVAIYGKSWKNPEPFPQFVPGLCRSAAAQGWLRLGIVRVATQPIAAQLWLVKDGNALIYKLAYDETHKQYSAGSVLSAEMMRLAIDDDRVVDVDYLTGDDAYKADWMSDRRERFGVLAFDPRHPLGLAGLLKQRLGRRWRRLRPDRRAETAAAAAAAEPGQA